MADRPFETTHSSLQIGARMRMQVVVGTALWNASQHTFSSAASAILLLAHIVVSVQSFIVQRERTASQQALIPRIVLSSDRVRTGNSHPRRRRMRCRSLRQSGSSAIERDAKRHIQCDTIGVHGRKLLLLNMLRKRHSLPPADDE